MQWHSVTSGSTSAAEFVGRLREAPLALTLPGYTPLSDFRVVLLSIALFLSTIAVITRLPRPKFASSRAFLAVAVAHNAALSLASLVMLLGISKAVFDVGQRDGWVRNVCTPVGKDLDSAVAWWMYVFYLSKYWELFDTVLLIMRGRPLSVLHVWHHSSVLVEMWSWVEMHMVGGALGMIFNTLVHVLMYAYFAAALLKIRVPWKQALTSLQIVQFCASFMYLIPYMRAHRELPGGCRGGPGLLVSIVCNGSFLVLFLDFYRKTYKTKSVGKTL